MALHLFLLGASGIKEIYQTVDSGQVENTRWSETSSGVLKVRLFSLGTGETGDITRQLCDKAVNCRSKICRACTLYFIIITVRSAMLDITEYKMMNRESWLELYQTNTRSNTIKTVVIYSLIFICLFIIIQGQEAGPDTYGQS